MNEMNHRRTLFQVIETKNPALLEWEVLSFSNLPILRSHAGNSISLVYLNFLTLSALNSKLPMKVQLSERQFLYHNHTEKV